MVKFNRIFLIATIFCFFGCFHTTAQVNAVEFGRNRVQFKKFKWQYYQTRNFNTYFNQFGQELAKFVAQVAEEELPGIESFTEYSLQRRANIVIYNSFADMQQSNIGIGIDWQNSSGATKLVNNKMVVYFNGDHEHLKKQIRTGIAKILTDNLLFGDDLGEVASNQALLDLPKWMTDGYVAFTGENWSTQLDDELKSEILSNDYHNFYQFAFEKPEIAGHAFWYFIQEKYKKENVTYLFYLTRVYKNLNKASLQVCKKKFKEVLAEFMEYEEEKYNQDIAKRKAYPKGSVIESFDINKRKDYYRINVNPNKKNSSYAVVEYNKGIVRLKLIEDDATTVLLKYGILSYQNETNPDYPIMAWDPKGTRLSVIYTEEGRIKLFVYDVVTREKYIKWDLTSRFQHVQDVKYMLDSKTLLLSAVKNGHTDIYTYDVENQNTKQITNDVYDDLDATFVSFPGKTGIIFSSNRPTANTKGGDTSLPSHNRYNIFLITNFGDKPELNQITQLSNLKYGNARFPMPYNVNHFTFISDENGVGNRYAGFFTTKSAGLDTLVLIGDEILRNPSPKEVDSTLRVFKKTDVDSVAVVAVSKDSAYTFPLTNYESSVAETRIAGDNNQVSEVTRQSDEKTLYKLKIDENTLRKRNVSVPPTAYMKSIVMADKILENTGTSNDQHHQKDNATNSNDGFQSDFDTQQKKDSIAKSPEPVLYDVKENTTGDVLQKAKLYTYKPVKFAADYGGVGFNNVLLASRYQQYAGGSGPVNLNSNTALTGLIRLGTSELMEDVKITGAFRLSTNLKDNQWMMSYQNLKRRIDWGLTFFRSVDRETLELGNSTAKYDFAGKAISNLYQANVSYPFDNSKRIALVFGIRNDRHVLLTDVYNPTSTLATLYIPDFNTTFATSHLEYVYDNTLNPTQNIWNGLRYKFYIDWNTDISKEKNNSGKYNFNWGADVRYYYPIYRNFIWAGRAAADFSWGAQKTIYYLGGMDGWLMFGGNIKNDGNYRYFNESNQPAADVTYAYQSLAQNLRGFIQNVANGNNAVVLNSEFRLPVLSTFFNQPVNNAFLRNFQLTQFIDLGTAWNGGYNGIKRPTITYGTVQTLQVITKAGGIGPFAGGYGFGARSTLLGYFLKFDAGWPMDGFFRGKPIMYVSMGLDF